MVFDNLFLFFGVNNVILIKDILRIPENTESTDILILHNYFLVQKTFDLLGGISGFKT